MLFCYFLGLNTDFKKHLENMLGGNATSVGVAKTVPSARPQSSAPAGPTSPPPSNRNNMPLPPTPHSMPGQTMQDHEYEELPVNFIRPDDTTYYNDEQF